MQIANFGESAIEVTRIVRIGDAHEAPPAIYNLHFSIFNLQCSSNSIELLANLVTVE